MSGGAAADEARIFVQRNDLLDDSIAAERYYVTLKLRSKDKAPNQYEG